jgi:type II secretory pathway predicted ATPase ExeA
MVQKMTTEELRDLRTTVRARFIEGPMDDMVARELEYIVQNIKDFDNGAASPRRGVFVYGPSGTGKTTAFRHAVAKIPEFQPYENKYGEWVNRAIYLKLSSRCSSAADIIRALLKLMNLPTEGKVTELQEELLRQLKEREISLIHLDELQHSVRSNTAKAFEAIQDLVKELLDREDWHLHMILGGMPRIHNMRADNQIKRRTFVLPFHSMDFETDDQWVEKLLFETAVTGCGLTLDKDLLESEFRERLCRSVNGAWGTMIEFIQGASFRALARNRTMLKMTDFTREYERVSGFPDDENMFLARNFRDLDTTDLKFGMED